MEKEVEHDKFWSALSTSRDICEKVSIIDDLKEEELRQLHQRIRWQKAPGLNLNGYLEEVSRKLAVEINKRKLEKLAQLVGENATRTYLVCCVCKVMWNMGIINIRVEDT